MYIVKKNNNNNVNITGWAYLSPMGTRKRLIVEVRPDKNIRIIVKGFGQYANR